MTRRDLTADSRSQDADGLAPVVCLACTRLERDRARPPEEAAEAAADPVARSRSGCHCGPGTSPTQRPAALVSPPRESVTPGPSLARSRRGVAKRSRRRVVAESESSDPELVSPSREAPVTQRARTESPSTRRKPRP